MTGAPGGDAPEPPPAPAEEPGAAPGVPAPRQARSRRTLERLLTAAERMLRERSFDEIPVREISDRAGYTVGAFYARFEDKGALLERLHRRTVERFESTVEECLGGPRWSRPETEGRLADVFTSLLEFHRRERGMLRTLLRRAGDDEWARAELDRMDETLARRLDERLPRARGSWPHPDPDRGLGSALALVLGAIRSSEVLGRASPLDRGLDERERAATLARAYIGAAGIGSTGGGLFR